MKLIQGSMEVLARNEQQRITTEKKFKEIVNKLDTKKAKNAANWSNDMIVEGDTEIIRSLVKIFYTVDNEIDIPNEWEKMEILSINKKGSKMKMENKRGLFLKIM